MKLVHRENILRLTCALRFLTISVFALQVSESLGPAYSQAFWHQDESQVFLTVSSNVITNGDRLLQGSQLTVNCTIVFPQFSALFMPYPVFWHRKKQDETQWTRIASDDDLDDGCLDKRCKVTLRYPESCWDYTISYELTINGLIASDSATYKCSGVDNPNEIQWSLNAEATTPYIFVMPCNGACANDFFITGNQVVFVVATQKPSTFSDARKYCKATYNASLASINNQEDQSMIEQFLFSNSSLKEENYWIGVYSSGFPYIWTRLCDVGPISYSNWNVNEPSSEDEFCVSLFGVDDKWNNLPCDVTGDDFGRTMFFICQIGGC